MRRHALGRLVVAGALASLPFATGSPSATAAPFIQYNLVATADGVQELVDVPNFLVIESVELGVPEAQAVVSSTNGSTAYASAPYPGSGIATLPNTANGLLKTDALPSYPAYVGTSYPASTAARASTPLYSLMSHSTQLRSSATGSGGVTASKLHVASFTAAVSDRELVDGQAVVSADSDVYGLDVAGLLRVGEVHATASAIIDKAGKLVRNSSLDIGQTTIGGIGVDLTDKGLVIGSMTLPVPRLDALTKLLRKADLTVQYVEPRKIKDGIVSAALDITEKRTLPAGLPDVGGLTVTQTFVIGGATAVASSTTAGTPTPIPTSTSRPSPTGVGSGVAPITAGHDGLPAVNGVGGSGPQLGESSGAPSGQAPTVVPGEATAAQPAAVAASAGTGFRMIYLVLVLAALAAFGAGTLWRVLGVRLTWT